MGNPALGLHRSLARSPQNPVPGQMVWNVSFSSLDCPQTLGPAEKFTHRKLCVFKEQWILVENCRDSWLCPPPQLAPFLDLHICSWHRIYSGQQPCCSWENRFRWCDEIQYLSACHIHTGHDVCASHSWPAASSPSALPHH